MQFVLANILERILGLEPGFLRREGELGIDFKNRLQSFSYVIRPNRFIRWKVPFYELVGFACVGQPIILVRRKKVD